MGGWMAPNAGLFSRLIDLDSLFGWLALLYLLVVCDIHKRGLNAQILMLDPWVSARAKIIIKILANGNLPTSTGYNCNVMSRFRVRWRDVAWWWWLAGRGKRADNHLSNPDKHVHLWTHAILFDKITTELSDPSSQIIGSGQVNLYTLEPIFATHFCTIISPNGHNLRVVIIF